MTARLITDVVDSASGRLHRDDPTLPITGGPAGNAEFTAWVGLVLLPVFVAELVTLLALDQLVTWHIVLGVLLVPPSLLKTATTGWRLLRYYSGNSAYRHAGPPPLLLRLLGPVVVVSTLALLGTGLSLVALGPRASFTSLGSVAGQQITALTLHQASTLVWAAATGVHVLARAVPAALTIRVRDPQPPGNRSRALLLVATLVSGVVVAVIVLGLSSAWTKGDLHRFDHHGPPEHAAATSWAFQGSRGLLEDT
jgi:hypothetical protein